MNNTKKSGFTLIELLVVVAIIGILASLVIASLNQARSRGVDAAIKGTMSSLRAQAEIYYDDNTSYASLFSDPAVDRLVDDVETKSGGTVVFTTTPTAWTAYIPLTTDATDIFCVDSTGYAGLAVTATPVVSGACDPV